MDYHFIYLAALSDDYPLVIQFIYLDAEHARRRGGRGRRPEAAESGGSRHFEVGSRVVGARRDEGPCGFNTMI